MKVKEPEIEVVDMPMELSVFDPIDAQIAEAKKKNANIVFIYDDPIGNKEARSWIAFLRKFKKPIIETHKLGKAEAMKYCKEWDKAKNKRIEALEEMIKVHHEPVWEIEQREAAIEAERLLEITRAKDAEEAARQAELEARELAAAEKEAANKKKEEELLQKERETRLAESAEEKAIAKAQQALAAAENRRIADIEAVKNKAAAEAAEKERILQVKASKEAHDKEVAAREEQERQANVEHRRQIHKDIYEYLLDLFSEKEARSLTLILIEKQVPHVTINY